MVGSSAVLCNGVHAPCLPVQGNCSGTWDVPPVPIAPGHCGIEISQSLIASSGSELLLYHLSILVNKTDAADNAAVHDDAAVVHVAAGARVYMLEGSLFGSGAQIRAVDVASGGRLYMRGAAEHASAVLLTCQPRWLGRQHSWRRSGVALHVHHVDVPWQQTVITFCNRKRAPVSARSVQARQPHSAGVTSLLASW